MWPAAPRLLFIGALRLVFFIDGDRNAFAAEFFRHGHDGVRRLGKWRMVVVRRYRFGIFQVGDTDDTETAMPATCPHFVSEPQRVMKTVAFARPARLFPTGDMLSRHPPA